MSDSDVSSDAWDGNDAKDSLTHEQLEELAARYHPPQEWLDGDEEALF